MSGSKVDTTLVIRARDEASKAVSAIEGALEQLLGTQRKVAAGSETAASGLTQIIGVLAQLDRAYARIWRSWMRVTPRPSRTPSNCASR